MIKEKNRPRPEPEMEYEGIHERKLLKIYGPDSSPEQMMSAHPSRRSGVSELKRKEVTPEYNKTKVTLVPKRGWRL